MGFKRRRAEEHLLRLVSLHIAAVWCGVPANIALHVSLEHRRRYDLAFLLIQENALLATFHAG